MNTTIAITKASKQLLNGMREQYNFSSYNELISQFEAFFRLNKLNPRDITLNNFDKKIVTLNRTIEDENERIIKIIRNIELTKIDSVIRKLSNVEKGFTEFIFTNRKQNLIDDFTKSDDNNSSEYLLTIEKLKNEINDFKISKVKIEKDLSEYHRCLETLNKSLKVVNSDNERKAFFNISVEEVEQLFYLIP